MFTIPMFDACLPGNVPGKGSSAWVAGYLDGPCKWPGEGWSAFPLRRKVRITTQANELADVFDWEHGTATLTSVRYAIEYRARSYLASVVYCSFLTWDTAKSALNGLPVAWWVADWTGKDHLVPGSVATQWGSFPTYDASTVDRNGWPKLP